MKYAIIASLLIYLSCFTMELPVEILPAIFAMKVNERKRNDLFYALQYGDSEKVKILLGKDFSLANANFRDICEERDDQTGDNETPLLAAIKDQKSIAKALKNENSFKSLLKTLQQEKSLKPLAKVLKPEKSSRSIIKALLKAGANVNLPAHNNQTPLIKSIFLRNEKLALKLLDKGADTTPQILIRNVPIDALELATKMKMDEVVKKIEQVRKLKEKKPLQG